eukprot:3742531-Pleurochrysis_carterae.AAC.1
MLDEKFGTAGPPIFYRTFKRHASLIFYDAIIDSTLLHHLVHEVKLPPAPRYAPPTISTCAVQGLNGVPLMETVMSQIQSGFVNVTLSYALLTFWCI